MNRVLVALALLAGCQSDLRLGVVTQQGGATFMVDPTSWDFGSIAVGGSDVTTIVVSTFSDGGEDLTISTTDCPDFVLPDVSSPVHISATEPLAMEIMFTPTSAAVLTCDITFQGDINQVTVNLVGTGTVTGPVATVVTPASLALDFGEVPVNVTSAAQQIEIRNDGGSTLTISGYGFQTGGGDDLAVIATGSDSVEPGLSQTWDVTCTRTANGVTAGTYEITHDDPNLGPILIEITCTGVSTNIYATPVPGVFGEILVGTSRQASFLLHNDGSSAATVVSTDLTETGPGGFTHDLTDGTVVPSGGTAPFDVTFTPSGDGEVTGILAVTMDGPDAVNLGLSGSGATAIISVTPPDPVIDLGTACVGAATERVHIGIRNAGTGAYFLAGVNFDPLYPFTGQSFDVAPTDLPPGGTVEWSLDAWFEPTEAGDRDGALQINTNVPGDMAHRVPLHGRGLDAVVGATAVSAEFGAVEVGELSGAEDLGVMNCTAAGVIVGVELRGDDADAFEILPGDPTADVSVGMGETTTWSVLFQPTRTGAHEASLTITWADGSVEIPLTGLGVMDLLPDPDPDPEDRGSYLACASGGPGSLGLVLLVLVAISARRGRTPGRSRPARRATAAASAPPRATCAPPR